ncbi:hypothetical protein GCM10010271_55960 [Streptomyces kurssanovii]|nr:hypothetical protein GCM10010271_55960 [Streptomyces kurssanovii]
MWDTEPEPGAGTCAACGVGTDDGRAQWIPRMSGPDVRIIVHADSADCRPPVAAPHRLPSAPVHTAQRGRVRPRPEAPSTQEHT